MPSSSLFLGSCTTFFAVLITFALSVRAAPSQLNRRAATITYSLDTDFSGTKFFDGFNFFNGGDPTHGFVTYRGKDNSMQNGRAYYANVGGSVAAIMTVDYKNKINGNKAYVDGNGNAINGVGRASVRIESKKSWTKGLFIADILHMPSTNRGGYEGCGVWPAFWTLGGGSWPYTGEIDILEGVNNQVGVKSFAHTGYSCWSNENGISNGWVQGNDCQVYFGNGQMWNTGGCGTQNSNAKSYGKNFNNNGGGVYAMQWTDDFIKVWFFPRNAIPSNIQSGKPDPSSWGNPFNIIQGSCNINQNFQNHRLVFDTTFCGDWAGATFGDQCGGLGSCAQYVANNPGDFAEAYWAVRSVKIYSGKTTNTNMRLFNADESSSSTTQTSTTTQTSSSSTLSTRTQTGSSSTTTTGTMSTSTHTGSSSTATASTSTRTGSSSTGNMSASTHTGSTSTGTRSTSSSGTATASSLSTSRSYSGSVTVSNTYTTSATRSALTSTTSSPAQQVFPGYPNCKHVQGAYYQGPYPDSCPAAHCSSTGSYLFICDPPHSTTTLASSGTTYIGSSTTSRPGSSSLLSSAKSLSAHAGGFYAQADSSIYEAETATSYQAEPSATYPADQSHSYSADATSSYPADPANIYPASATVTATYSLDANGCGPGEEWVPYDEDSTTHPYDYPTSSIGGYYPGTTSRAHTDYYPPPPSGEPGRSWSSYAPAKTSVWSYSGYNPSPQTTSAPQKPYFPWDGYDDHSLTITLTKTWVEPCVDGYCTKTTEMVTTHCGCTATPLPKIPTKVTTIVPEQGWPVTTPCVVTVPDGDKFPSPPLSSSNPDNTYDNHDSEDNTSTQPDYSYTGDGGSIPEYTGPDGDDKDTYNDGVIQDGNTSPSSSPAKSYSTTTPCLYESSTTAIATTKVAPAPQVPTSVDGVMTIYVQPIPSEPVDSHPQETSTPCPPSTTTSSSTVDSNYKGPVATYKGAASNPLSNLSGLGVMLIATLGAIVVLV